MSWGLDKDKVRGQWKEWTAFTEVARGDEPAGLQDMFGRVFRWQEGGGGHDTSPSDREVRLDPVDSPEATYAITQLAHLTEARVLTSEEFNVFQARVRGG